MKRCLLPLLFAFAIAPATGAPADDLVARFSKAYRALDMRYLALSYRENIASLVRETDIAAQRKLFGDLQRDLQQLDRSGLTPCQRLDLQRIGFETGANLHKLDVLERFAALGEYAVAGDQGLYPMPLGREWYRYFLKRWLSSDIAPEQLKTSGEAELARVLARYRTLQTSMGYAGRDDAFYAYLKSSAFMYPKGQTPKADYEARQHIVFANLARLFPPHSLKPAIVAESSRGDAFPADGYYESGSRTFYFNQNGPLYQRRNVDMLLLHESTPGHHFQSHYAAQAKGGCRSALPPIFYAAFSEGWSAYVEEFGKELGVYRLASDELGAVEWDLVRSIRVVLDVGINYEGWSDERAHAYWRQQLPMLPHLAEREIARVRNWPAQAITYKYGAALIRDLRAAEQSRLGAGFDIKTFHDTLLRNGAMPLSVMPSLFPAWIHGRSAGVEPE